ncbi:hypothetical protein [Oerskovia jenensis]|uniref:hypothetical protein n=1 Tax=Oerskovia jenensis TaxID=162169 RepID=UPI0036DC0E72
MALTDINAEAVVIEYVRDALADATPVKQKVPAKRPKHWVQIVRTGGTVLHRVVDRAQLTVTAWDEDDEVEAERLANRCREALLAATRVRPGKPRITKVEVLGYYYDPDPDSNAQRYTFTVIASVRASNRT